MPLEFMTLDVFTGERFEGNPLAVFPDAAGTPGALMQRIANEFNLSETVFVLPPEAGGDARLRIFSPMRELPFAGHPTIGAALALSLLGRAGGRLRLEEEVGIVTVAIEQGVATLSSPQAPQRRESEVHPEELASILGLPRDLVQEVGICDAGVAFTMIEVVSPSAVDDAALDIEGWRRSLAKSSAPHIYVFCRLPEASTADADIYSRMFAPAMGIPEDPATGAATVALAAWLEPGCYRVRQGVKMGRPSQLLLEAGAEVRLGGRAVPVTSGVLYRESGPIKNAAA